jgi:hypothetical protein
MGLLGRGPCSERGVALGRDAAFGRALLFPIELHRRAEGVGPDVVGVSLYVTGGFAPAAETYHAAIRTAAIKAANATGRPQVLIG